MPVRMLALDALKLEKDPKVFADILDILCNGSFDRSYSKYFYVHRFAMSAYERPPITRRCQYDYLFEFYNNSKNNNLIYLDDEIGFVFSLHDTVPVENETYIKLIYDEYFNTGLQRYYNITRDWM